MAYWDELTVRILYLSPRQSFPPVTGAKLRDLHLARALGRNADVTCLYFIQPDAPAARADDLCCRELIGVPQARRYTPRKAVSGIFGRLPLPILNYTSPEMRAALREVMARKQFDLAHIDGVHMAGYQSQLEQTLPSPLIVYDWHNIESEAMLRYSANTPSPAKRIYAALTGRRMAAMETRMLQSAFGHLVCSAREQRQLLARVPAARVEVIDNGVDVSAFQPLPPVPRSRLLFVGSMSYHANSEAAEAFARQTWPLVRERFPQWRLTLVGSDPPPQILALGSLPGVEVTGTVPDVRPYYQAAAAAIVPLRIGGGTRLKILEAMAAGAPVVSSTLGAEGLEVSRGREILIADTAEEWLVALDTIANDPARTAALTASARALVEARYDWRTLGDRLFAIYSEWIGRG